MLAGKENKITFLESEIHRLKGAMGAIGAPEMMEYSRLLEKCAKEKYLASAMQLLQVMPQAFTKLKHALQDIIDNNE